MPDHRREQVEAELQELGLTGAPETVLFVYDEAGHLIGEYREDGTLIREIVYLSDTPVAVNTESGLHYIHTDHLGTPRAISEPAGPVVWRWVGDPFGIGEAANDPDGDGEEFIYRGRFPGQYFDTETGLHYNYFRDYEPRNGRYVESDPIGLDGGINAYVYAGSDPIKLVDPEGLKQICLPGMRCVGDQDDPNRPGEPKKRKKKKTKTCAETQPNFASCLSCCATPSGRAASGDPRSPSPCWDDCGRRWGLTERDERKPCGS